MTFSPIIFVGNIYSQVFSEIVFTSEVFKKGLIRVIDNVKFETNLTSLSGDIPLQAYKSRLSQTGTDASSTLKLSDSALKPVKVMAYDEIDLSALVNTRFSEDMKAGAANITSNEFEQAIISYATPKISNSYVKAFWGGVTAASKTAIAAITGNTANQRTKIAALNVNSSTDGIISKLVQSKACINVSGTTLTASNIVAEFEKLFTAAPAEVVNSSDTYIYAPLAAKQLILSANKKQTYRDIFNVVVTGNLTEIYYNGKTVIFDYLPDNTLIFARSSDLIAGMDLLADSSLGSLQVDKVSNNSDILFIKAVMTLDTAVTSPSQITLYC